MTQAAGIDAYLAEFAHQRLASAHTLAAYRRDLAKLVELADGADPAGLAAPPLRRFVMQLHGRGLSPRSLARLLSARMLPVAPWSALQTLSPEWPRRSR
jgi:integrase/recombinase XerC